MNVLVIVGSPKGKDSVTLHTCLYLEKQFPRLQFDYIYPGQRIKALEKDFSPAMEALRKADLLLFCYPVYTFLVPYQLHRFIELMKASGADFSGKMATQVSTSKHFYDITAHRFIQDHSMGSRFKLYDDRQFCNGHRTVTMGTPFGYLVEGAYSKEENLRLLLEARAQVGGKFTEGMVGPYRKAAGL